MDLAGNDPFSSFYDTIGDSYFSRTTKRFKNDKFAAESREEEAYSFSRNLTIEVNLDFGRLGNVVT